MPITSDHHWEVKLYNIKIDNDTVNQTVSKAMFDTGSSLTYIHVKEYNAFLKKIYKVTTC